MPFRLLSSLTRFDRRLWALALGWLINAFGFSMAYPFLSIYLFKERGIPMEKVGLVFLAMGLARMTGPLVSGALCDFFGRRRILVGAPAVQTCFFVFLAVAVHKSAPLGLLTLLLTCANLMGSFFHAAADTYVADLVPPGGRADAYSFIRIGINIGWMVGPAVGAFLVRTPFSHLFMLTAVSALILSAVAWTFYREAEQVGRGSGEQSRLSLAVFKEHPSFFRHCFFALCVFLVSSQLVSTLSVYSTDAVGISRQQLGLLYTLNGALVIVLQYPVSRLFSRWPLKWPAAIGALFYSAGYFSLAFARGYAWLVASVTVITCGEILVFPSNSAVASRHAPPGATGRFVGLYGMAWGIGYTVGPWIGNTLYGMVGADRVKMWGLIAASGVLAAVGFATARHKAAAERG